MKKLFDRYKASLTKQMLLLLIALVVIPSVVLSYTLTHLARNQLERELLSQVDEVTTMMNQVFNETQQDFSVTISSLADLSIPPGQNRDTYIYDRIRNVAKDSDNVLAAFVSSKGNFYTSSENAKTDYDPTTRGWYKQAMKQKGQLAMTDPYIDVMSGSYVITFSKTTADGSGVAGIDVAIDNLNEMVGSFTIGDRGYVSLFDRNNVTISHPHFTKGEPVKGEQFEDMRKQEQGTFMLAGEGRKEYYSYDKRNALGLNVVSVLDSSEITEKTSKLQWIAGLFIALLLGLIGLFIWIFMKRMIVPIMRLKTMTGTVAQGDLTVRINENGRIDEIGQLETNFNAMSRSLSDVLIEISTHSEQVSAASQELSANSEQNVSTIEQVAASMQEVSAKSSDMNSSIQAVKQTAEITRRELENTLRIVHESAEASQQINELANTGEEALSAAKRQMDAILDHSNRSKAETETLNKVAEEISGITGFIQAIASQTNLLALNAAIEAARAGQEGRGFAVVAQEVRKLADQAGTAAGKIAALIGDIQDRTRLMLRRMEEGVESASAGSELTQSVEHCFADMYSAIASIDEQLGQVARVGEQLSLSNEATIVAFDEVSVMSHDTANEMDMVAAASEEQNASMEEIAASAVHLSSIAEELQSLVAGFKLNMEPNGKL